MILSLGGLRCNMMCPFCQNHAIAHPSGPIEERGVSFEYLIRKTRGAGLKSVAYTYNEPTLQAEYIFAASPVLRENGIATVMVTNGMFSDAVLDEAIGLVDAMNIDVKTFDGAIYKKLGGSLETVRRNVERLVSGGVHVEITNLIVPGVSDSESDFAAMTDWIAEISPEVPLHISRYFPAFRSAAPATDISLIRGFYDIARGRLKYVYMGNV
jgi:pyruvate formate lyase activating enzyme